MSFRCEFLSRFLPLTAIFLAATSLASAGTIDYTCASNIDSLGPSSTCSTLNTTIAGLYSSTFSNANANIYIQYGNTGLGESEQYLNFVSYSSYRSALIAENGPGTVRADAAASLPSSEPSLYSGSNVEVTAALGAALGFSGMTGITSGGASCALGSSGCYNAIITLATPADLAAGGQGYYYRTGTIASNEYDIFSVVEHETDEVLGTSSCIDTSGSLTDGCGGKTPSAVDLYRYSSGSRVLINSTPGAYFSYDGGATNGANGFDYNTLPNGDDYADFVSSCPGGPFSIQDAEGCPGSAPGLDITNDGGAEINILDAVGYNLNRTTTPEPGTLFIAGMGLIVCATFVRRRFRG